MPNANRLTVRIMTMVAEDAGLRISARTKAALAAAKARGTKLGGINLNVGLDAATFVKTFREARAALGNAETQRTHRRSPVTIEHDDAG